MSCKTSSVTLAMVPTHASEAHVAVVRGVPPPLSSPHEDSSPNLAIAPMHVLSDSDGDDDGAELAPGPEIRPSLLIETLGNMALQATAVAPSGMQTPVDATAQNSQPIICMPLPPRAAQLS